MIQLFTGENDFALKENLRLQIHTFREQHSQDAVVVRDGDKIVFSDLPELLSGQTLFSPQQLVVISDLSQNKSIWDKLPEQLDSASSDIIFVESKLDKRTRTYKWLQKNATVRQFNAPSEAELRQWLEISAHQRGIDIAPEVGRYLLAYVGTDQWRLSQEIHKLALAKKPITQDLIRDIVDPNPQATVFELLDAVIAGEIDRVEQLVGTLARVEDPYKFIGLLTSQLYALALVYAAGEKSAATIAKDAGLHPYVVGKMQSSARRMPRGHLTMMIETIAECDRKLKSTGGDPWMLIRTALIKIAA